MYSVSGWIPEAREGWFSKKNTEIDGSEAEQRILNWDACVCVYPHIRFAVDVKFVKFVKFVKYGTFQIGKIRDIQVLRESFKN